MSTARDFLAENLTAALGPSWVVIPWDDNPTITAPTVLFYRTSVAPTPEAPSGSWTHEMTVGVAGPRQEGEAALDAVDDLLDEVLIALHGIEGVTWTAAEYAVLGDAYPAFRITAQVRTKPAEPEPAP